MKRVLNLFFALAICFSFAACTDDDNENYIIDVKKSDDSMQITVSVPYVDGMSYVNIFRRDNYKDIFNNFWLIQGYTKKKKIVIMLVYEEEFSCE